MFSSASQHTHYIYTVMKRHVQLCLTRYTVKLHCTLPPCLAVPHYINSLATVCCTVMFSCTSLHIEYSYTVLYRHVQLCLTTYTDRLQCVVPPCSDLRHYIYSIATLHCNAMFSCSSLHIQKSYTVLYRLVKLCLLHINYSSSVLSCHFYLCLST